MKCHEIKSLIYLHLDGEATQKQQSHLFDHLKECASCRNELALAKCTHEMLMEHCTLVDDVPDGFCDSIISRIDFQKQDIPLTINKKSIIGKKRKPWESRLGIGLIASALGLFFTYSLTFSNFAPKIAQQGDTPPKNSNTEISVPKTNTQVAQQPQNKSSDNNTDAKTQEQIKETTNKSIDNEIKPTVPKESPVQVPAKVARTIADLTPTKESVELPQPLSVSKIIYNQPAEKASASVNNPPEQKLITQLPTIPGVVKKVSQVSGKIELITVQNQLAKLWRVETIKNTKAQEIDSMQASGLLYAVNGKIQSIEGVKMALSPKGEVALLTVENGDQVLAIGENRTLLSGKVISNLTWSPDGKKVLYFLENDKLGHLESFDGVERTQLTPDMPVQDIAWTFLSNDKMLLNITTDTPGIWQLELTEAKLTALTNNGGGKCITVNKNGDIAFTDAAGKIYVLLHNAPTDAKLIQMTSDSAAVVNLTWQDDKTLLYVVAEQEQTQIWKAILP